jgi:hypothetical protein
MQCALIRLAYTRFPFIPYLHVSAPHMSPEGFVTGPAPHTDYQVGDYGLPFEALGALLYVDSYTMAYLYI